MLVDRYNICYLLYEGMFVVVVVVVVGYTHSYYGSVARSIHSPNPEFPHRKNLTLSTLQSPPPPFHRATSPDPCACVWSTT